MAAYTTIDDPSAYFKVQLFTGTGSSNAVTFNDTDTDMQPDVVWIKERDGTNDHNLFDAVRGTGKLIRPNGTNAEGDTDQGVTAFGSDGFTVGTNTSLNGSSQLFVAWCWKAGTTSGIGSGDITPSSYSFNTTSGFSVVAYTGTLTGSGTPTVPHGLGVAPDVVITKELSGASAWYTQHTILTTASHHLSLNTTDAESSSSGNGTMSFPTATVFDTNWSGGLNEDGETYIAYSFTPIQGFSKFGQYEGNNNANGPFVYTGFRPALVISRSIDSTSDWHLTDNKRLGYNSSNSQLFPSTSAAENSTQAMDLLSNGFKLGIVGDPNVAETFVYMAFAEAPFVNSNGVPCNAR